jgi:hypothetical protein
MSEKRNSLQRLLETQMHTAISALHNEVISTTNGNRGSRASFPHHQFCPVADCGVRGRV